MKVGDVCVWSSSCDEWKGLDVKVGDIAGIVIDITDNTSPRRCKILELSGELSDYSKIFLEKVNEKR
jgi:hypothetical protein